MYGLQAGSINYWLPLTPVLSTSALWVEEESVPEPRATASSSEGNGSPGPGRAENSASAPFPYRPLLKPTRFDGRRLLHFTVPNRSGKTRVSLDFRCVPSHAYDPSARLSRQGYYSLAVREEGSQDDLGWRKAESGRVSKLHGLPHTSQPLEQPLRPRLP